MYRPTHWRAAISSAQRLAAAPASRIAGRHYASTFAGKASAKATGTLVRWGLAGAAVYYYNTSTVFAEEPSYLNKVEHSNDETYHTIDTIAEQRRAQARQSQNSAQVAITDASAPSPIESPEGLEEEAQQQGAFNEETGEINWDCPCLGGMAHGPCGEQFRSAFSCFVFSKEEPKGIDCIENFKTMQNCFREHPDIYGAELTEDDDDDAVVEDHTGPVHAVEVARESINDTVENTADAISADAGKVAQTVRSEIREVQSSTPTKTSAPVRSSPPSSAASSSPAMPSASQTPNAAKDAGDEGGELMPKAWHDTTSDNGQSK